MHIVMQIFDGDINQRVGGQPYLHGDIVGMSPEYHCNTSWIYLVDGDMNWLVVSNIRIIFHFIYGIYNPKPIDCHSIIFQDVFFKPPSSMGH